LKVFISYATGDGLDLAKEAREIFKADGYETWLYVHDKTTGAPTWREIATSLIDSDVMFYICTASTINSDGQVREANIALNNRVTPMSIKIDEASVPPELTSENWTNWNAQDFSQSCKALSDKLPEELLRIHRLSRGKAVQPQLQPLDQRRSYFKKLNGRVLALDNKRVQKAKEQIVNAHQCPAPPRFGQVVCCF
jgi:hypothetical protein